MQSFSSILGATLPMGSKRTYKTYMTEELIFPNNDTKKNCLRMLVLGNNYDGFTYKMAWDRIEPGIVSLNPGPWLYPTM